MVVDVEVSDHLAMAFFCPSCKRTLRLNRHGITQHRAECSAAPDAAAPGGPPPPWRCEKCNFTLPGATWPWIFFWGHALSSAIMGSVDDLFPFILGQVLPLKPHDYWRNGLKGFKRDLKGFLFNF